MQHNDKPSTGSPKEALGPDFIVPILSLALVAYYALSTTELAWEAKATGLLVGVVLAALCLVQLARVLGRIGAGTGSFSFGELFAATPENGKRLGLVVLTTLFIVSIQWIGTTLGLFLLMVSLMFIMGVRKWTTLIAVAATTAGAVWVMLIFLLGSKLPQGPVEKALTALTGVGG